MADTNNPVDAPKDSPSFMSGGNDPTRQTGTGGGTSVQSSNTKAGVSVKGGEYQYQHEDGRWYTTPE
ncbi:hypothetical protein [Pseudomonas sp. MWU12-2037]|uniref:hypothetical protein n=1 Tax=Pseudomonas sp. MWU12-2037 TaxID=2928690 RepID=UPI00200CDADB|nr:hypothetical protein [Pseudomonas sp. MWU12-2037]